MFKIMSRRIGMVGALVLSIGLFISDGVISYADQQNEEDNGSADNWQSYPYSNTVNFESEDKPNIGDVVYIYFTNREEFEYEICDSTDYELPIDCAWMYKDYVSDYTTGNDRGFNIGGENNNPVFWYENGVRQGTFDDSQGVIGDGTVRGREIYDHVSDAWYWLDSIYEGKRAENKEVWMPYVYQDEADWDDSTIREVANLSVDYWDCSPYCSDFIYDSIKNKKGKWVRYNCFGKMIKGWFNVSTYKERLSDKALELIAENPSFTPDIDIVYYENYLPFGKNYYYDPQTGAMVKGWATIGGKSYYFDEITGILQMDPTEIKDMGIDIDDCYKQKVHWSDRKDWYTPDDDCISVKAHTGDIGMKANTYAAVKNCNHLWIYMGEDVASLIDLRYGALYTTHYEDICAYCGVYKANDGTLFKGPYAQKGYINMDVVRRSLAHSNDANITEDEFIEKMNNECDIYGKEVEPGIYNYNY